MLFTRIRQKVRANTVIFIYRNESAKRLKLVYDRRMMLNTQVDRATYFRQTR
jgi:hypothetical protein